MELPDNILFIDKPTGMTSHDVVNRIRRKTGIKRVGHAGTLDPLATGLLIILVGREATKRQDEFMKQDKEYLVTARFGITTDSYDSEGNVTSEADPSEVTQERIEVVLDEFRGSIEQTVPAYSAIKIGGQKLYEQARKGKVIEKLPTRKVEIHELELVEFRKTHDVVEADLRVSCSSGTYIRSLVHDIGQVLHVGATVTQLRRTKIGSYNVAHAQTL